MDVRFIFKSGSGERRVIGRQLPVVLGRSRKAGLKIPAEKEFVSRRHCEFFVDESGRVCVKDLASTNSTLVDGREIAPETAVPVPSGAVVTIGNVAFRLEYAQPAAAGPPPAGAASPELAGAEPELEAVDAAAPVLPPTEPLPPAEAGNAEPLLAELEADAPAAGDFGFLAEAAPAAEDAPAAWPLADEEPPAVDDDNLDNFFKGLS